MLFLCLMAIGLAAKAQELEPTFKHSPNAERALALHQKDLQTLVDDFHRLTEQAGQRFAQSAKRHVERYESLVDREVRTLTRAGEFEPAKAANDLLTEIKALPVAPPNSEGLHFLSTQNLEAAGSDKVTKYGVDLLVNVESAGALFAKQVQSGADQYKLKVQAARQDYTEALEKVLANEQRAGRLEAVQEVQAAINAQQNLPEVTRPSLVPSADTAEADKPAYVGYFIIDYDSGFLDRQKYLVQLTEDGGMVHAKYLRTSKRKGKWETLSLPIEMISTEKDLLAFSHQDTLGDTEVVHEMWLGNGIPIQDRAYASKQDHRAKRNAAKGSVNAAGSPGADLLGLADGVYVMDMQEHKTFKGKASKRKYAIRIRVEDGVIYRTHRSWSEDAAEWEPVGHQFFSVETRDKHLFLTFDKNMLSYDNVYVIEMGDKDGQKISGWWKQQQRVDGDSPSLTGKLRRLKAD